MPRCAPDFPVPLALRPLERRVDDVVHQRGLARSADARDARQRVDRDGDVDLLQVVLGRAREADELPAPPPAIVRHRDRQFVAEVASRQRSRLLQQALERPREHDLPALLARAQPEIDHVVRDADHVRVVLDDDHRVALVAQLAEDRDEAKVVARVKADRRLVQDVQRADQRRAERGGQVDALRLAAREGGRQAVEREVVQADLGEEAEPAADLGEHLLRDGRLPLAQREVPEEALRLAHGQPAHVVDRPSADAHVPRFASEPCPAAIRAGLVAAIPAEEHADVDLVLLPLQPGEEAANALEVAAVSFDDEPRSLRGQIGPRDVEADAAGGGRHASTRRGSTGSAACSRARWRCR